MDMAEKLRRCRGNMDSPTAFRVDLICQLTAIGNSQELDEDTVQMEHAEKKEDVLGELLDYYTDDLIRYQPFAKEFSPSELREIRDFFKAVNAGFQAKDRWSIVQGGANHLLTKLGVDQKEYEV